MAGGPSEVTQTQGPAGIVGDGIENIFQGLFSGSGISTTPLDPTAGAGSDPKRRKQYAKLLRLRGKGKKFARQARLEGKLGLSPGGVFPMQSPFSGGGVGEGGSSAFTDSLSGVQLNPELNPYLNQLFERGADLTQTRLSSEFAGSGRNLGASYPARSQELQDLALGIFNPGNLAQFDPVETLIRRVSGLLPGAQFQSTQPVFKTGIF